MEMLLLQLRSEVKGEYMYLILEICNKIESSIQNNGNDTHP